MRSETEQREQPHSGVLAFQAPRELIAWVEAAAAAEGLSKSDILRRATIRDQRKTKAA